MVMVCSDVLYLAFRSYQYGSIRHWLNEKSVRMRGYPDVK